MDETEIFELWWRIQPHNVRSHLLSPTVDTVLSTPDARLFYDSIVREVALVEIDQEPADGEVRYQLSSAMRSFLDRKRREN